MWSLPCASLVTVELYAAESIHPALSNLESHSLCSLQDARGEGGEEMGWEGGETHAIGLARRHLLYVSSPKAVILRPSPSSSTHRGSARIR